MEEENKYLEFYKNFKKNKSALVGLIIIVVLIILAIFAPLLTPYNPLSQDLAKRLIPPFFSHGGSLSHILGTDDFGRDMLTRLLYGARISLSVGFIAVGISLIFGLILGASSGYFGGKIDMIVMRFIDIMLSLPSTLLAIVIVAVLGPSLNNAMLAIGIVGIPTFARLVRSSVLAQKEKEYVVASKVNGSNAFRLITKVILPNCMTPIIVQASMGFAAAVLDAAGLSFLGLGAQAPKPEWGAMLVDSLEFITSSPWMILFPGFAIFLTVLGFNLLGDGLMDAFDHKMRNN